LIAVTTPINITNVILSDINASPIPSTIQQGEVVIETILPIQLGSFTGKLVAGRSVILEWETLSETNNYGFEVQRSAQQGSGYQTIPESFIPGHGTTIVPHKYSFLDSSADDGTLYYRLSQVDLDGVIHYSEGIRVDIVSDVREQAPSAFALYQNYPNPFNPQTEITFSVQTTDRTTLEVYNLVGQRIAQLFDDVAQAGRYYKVRFEGTSFSSGVYFYRLQSGKNTELRKLMLLK
jgi:hypothetical protein